MIDIIENQFSENVEEFICPNNYHLSLNFQTLSLKGVLRFIVFNF